MKLTISFINLNHTSELDEKIRKKIKKLEKISNKIQSIELFCHVKDKGIHTVEMNLVDGYHHGSDCVKSSAPNLIEAVGDSVKKWKRGWLRERKKCRKKSTTIREKLS